MFVIFIARPPYKRSQVLAPKPPCEQFVATPVGSVTIDYSLVTDFKLAN